MQKNYHVSNKDKKKTEQFDKEKLNMLYDRLHDMRKSIPKTIYGNSDNLFKLLELIKKTKEVLDNFIYKRRTTISPKDMEKLTKLYNQIVLLNKQIEYNNYKQFKVIEEYMNDFLEQIQFINSSINAVSKLNETIDISKLNTPVAQNSLKELQDKLDSITIKMSEKNKLVKDLNSELDNLNVTHKLLENQLKELNDIIILNKKNGTSYENEEKNIEETQKKFNESAKKILKKQEERDKYDNEYTDLRKEQLEITTKIEELKNKKGGRKTRKKRNRKKY